MKDALLRAVDEALRLGACFADVRAVDLEVSTVTARDGTILRAHAGRERGAMVRALFRGAWGVAVTTDLSQTGLIDAARRAVACAKAMGGSSVKVFELPSREDKVKAQLKRDPRDVALEDKSKLVASLNQELLKLHPAVKSASTSYHEEVGVTIYASSDGRYIEEERCLVSLYNLVAGEMEGIKASALDSRGSTLGFTVFDEVEDVKNTLKRKIESQLKGKPPKAGSYPAVFSPKAIGCLIHEAFGHLVEGDLVIAGTALKGRLGEKIASDLVTVVDDPTIPGAYGSYKYDDEGVEASPVTIVENGVLKNYMHSRETAAALGAKPTGNSRAQDFRSTPLVRMRNTYLKPGDHEVDELFEGIDFGYYVVSIRGGETDLDGTFQVGAEEAYIIVNGGVKEPVRGLSLMGSSIEALKHVDAVAKDFSLDYGMCGKYGQGVPVCDGGPHVRIKKMVFGGAQ